MRVNFLLLLALPVEGFFSNNAIRTAFKAATASRGVKWPEVLPTVKHKTLQECEYFDPSVQIPDYYRRNFHAYDGGNLNPVAAVEAMALTEAMLAFNYQGKTGAEANEFVRSTFNAQTRREMEKSELTFRPKTIVDLGCGIGVSTNFLAREFPSATSVYGIDLSPYYLDYAVRKPSMVYLHRDVAYTRFCGNSVDLVSMWFVLHELPLCAIRRALAECSRILKPGGVLAVCEMCPNIRTADALSRKLLDRTEPYMRDYIEFCAYRSDILHGAGFELPREVADCSGITMFFAAKRVAQ